MRKHLRTDESGMALMTVLLVSMLAAALMAGVFAAISTDQRSLGFDRDQSQAYAAAHAGLEKLTTQLAQLFSTDFSPNASQITAASTTPPSISGFNFVSPGGGSGYAVSFNADPCASCPNKGNPMPSASNDITTGPFAGFKGIITPYTLTVTARSTTGGAEVRLRREVQTVAVPVFQFGVFGERSLSFHAGKDFDFGGRVHTNENLFLAQQSSTTLTFRDKLTALGEVVRAELENGNTITSSTHTGTVTVPTVIGSSYRNLAATEGSVTGGPSSSKVSGWKNLSEVTYSTNIRNLLTGAKKLDLPLVSQGAKPIDLILRPPLGPPWENIENAPVFGQRYYAMAAIRILLSDRAADLTSLPTAVTATAPVNLETFVPASGPPVGKSIGNRTTSGTAPTYGGTGSTGTGTVTFATTTPSWLWMPTALTGSTGVAVGTGSPAPTIKNCTEMTVSTLKCDVSGGTIPYNTNFTVSLDSWMTGGVATSITLRTAGSGSMGTGSARTINLSTATTAAPTRGLAPATRYVWAGSTLITCAEYSTTQLKSCYWGSSPAIGSHVTTSALSDAGEPVLGGYIKIEKQVSMGVWEDVTTEWLNLGFSDRNQEGQATLCGDPTPNAIIRLQRLRDSGPVGGTCNYGTSVMATDFWPNALFDAREGWYRTQSATLGTMPMGGVMNYVTLDVGNFTRWLTGDIAGTGGTTWNNNGFIIYFSDRRGNHDWAAAGDPETGEYGNEDSINNSGGAGTAGSEPGPNGGAPEPGEDRNEDNTLQTYGARVENTVAGLIPDGALAPYDVTATPQTKIVNRGEARVNRQVLFRRALKLVNGGIVGGASSLPLDGLTVAAENGIYVQGDYNATSTDVEAEPNRPAAVIGDSIVILSNNWKDVNSFNAPNDNGGRMAATTGYRFAMIAGKSRAFPKPNWTSSGDWGTDGGVHNFMRMLEDWDGFTANYRGAMISLYTARQLIGTYKANTNTYAPPTRAFAFDTDFLEPSKLPPGTPMFRDVNTLRFRQILRPNQ
jgi:hypothetical protein